ncbi:TAXI family TRAP transporter solute-binding subunit [Hoeflea sp. WL0058]|uniref:TAXI family TRAP transporter solute-binding subunit n=1 Tax=Flavimaribacter sediminis TaxID=2865987 RepID=A0AAE3D4F3_9HYPH|nr:TAXI family TRAP transporter solute-binding subunit [Flavimaribacter sediminis]
MKIFGKTVALAALAVAFGAVQASAQVVTMATGAQGSLAYNSGQAVAKLANENGITARTQPLVGYLPLINNGEIDFGFTNGVDATFALKGTGNYDRANPNLMYVGVMFPLTTGIMAPCDLGIKTVDDLKSKAGELRIAAEYTSSSIIAYYIRGALATAGMTYDDFGTQVPVASFVAGINALGDDLVDVALVSLNSGAGKQAAVKLQGRGGLCYISLNNSAEALAAFQEIMPTAAIVEMPQNENNLGLESSGANIIRIPWMMLTNKDVSEELVYNITKAIAENKDTLKSYFGPFGLANPETMAPASDVPYHPGAVKYYEEAGIKVGG